MDNKLSGLTMFVATEASIGLKLKHLNKYVFTICNRVFVFFDDLKSRSSLDSFSPRSVYDEIKIR